ncbi:MAG: TetR family transcriptional regulator [Acidimicrobiales bacterium]|nr:TetR family transcriptional regulator [Acidimicrobiales bacterium]
MVADQTTLTDRQAERRRAVLRAALGLALEGGYDEVQMRSVAAEGGVALGTVYHYFSSKDHLLAEALLEWIEDFATSAEQQTPPGANDHDRVLAMLEPMTTAMANAPTLSRATITGLMSPDPAIGDVQQRIHERWSAALATAFDDSIDAGRRSALIRTIEHVWFSGLIGWVNGWQSIDDAIADLRQAVGLLLESGTSRP